MAYKKVIWSTHAKSELTTILEFYTERNGNPDYSLKFLKKAEDLINTLSKSEFIGRLTSNRVTRVIPIGVYLVFYEINGDQIEIVSFWDNRQDEEKRMDNIK